MGDPTEARVKAERLAEALRTNLKRRRATSRGSSAAPQPAASSEPSPRSEPGAADDDAETPANSTE